MLRACPEGAKERRYVLNSDASEIAKHQQVRISCHDDLRTCLVGAFKHSVVVGISGNRIKSAGRMHLFCEAENEIHGLGDVHAIPMELVVKDA